MAEANECTEVLRLRCEASPIRLDRLAGERGARQRGRAQEVRLRLRRLECERSVEDLERLRETLLVTVKAREVQQRQHEVRRDLDGLLQQNFRIIGPLCLARDQREEAQGIDVARVVEQDPAIDPLGFLEAALPLVLGGQGHQSPLRRQLEALFEGGIRFVAAAERGERLAEIEPGAFQRRIEPGRALEE